MEEYIYKLKAINLIRKAVSESYCQKDSVEKLLECIFLIDEFEEEIVRKIVVMKVNSS